MLMRNRLPKDKHAIAPPRRLKGVNMPAIKKIVVKNFKSFENLSLEFDPGRNVLIGDNETGKSSVLLALAGT